MWLAELNKASSHKISDWYLFLRGLIDFLIGNKGSSFLCGDVEYLCNEKRTAKPVSENI